MPSNHGRRFDEYRGVEELRPYSVEPHPEQTVSQEESQAAGAPPPENDNLVSQSNQLKLQRCAAADAEREQGDESGQNRDHARRQYGGGWLWSYSRSRCWLPETGRQPAPKRNRPSETGQNHKETCPVAQGLSISAAYFQPHRTIGVLAGQSHFSAWSVRVIIGGFQLPSSTAWSGQ
jgi:hypothetical protein